MSLFTATLLPALLLIATGGHVLWHGKRGEATVKALPRSAPAAYLTMGLASAWFLYHVLQLGPADFGQYKFILFGLFLAGALGSFIYVPDFLAVRGLAGLVLLASYPLLMAAYMQPPSSRLLLVGFLYLAITAAIYLGALPYRMRDLLDWLYRSERRLKLTGGAMAGYGLVLLGVALTY